MTPGKRLLFAALVAFTILPVHAQEPVFGPMRSDRGTEDRLYDLLKVQLRLTLDEQARVCEGEVTNRLTLLKDDADEVWFDAVGLQVLEVRVNGVVASFRAENARLAIRLPAPADIGEILDVTVRYRCETPSRGLYFIQPSEGEPELLPEIWSQGQAENNRGWIPTWDYPTDRATFEGEFTVRDGLTVVSNGALVEKHTTGTGWTAWRYVLDFPFPTYLISVCVGDYERYADEWRGIPVEYYVQRGIGEEKARRSFGQTPDMLEFYSSATGVPYPYPKYSQVAVQRFIAGGMENISATTQSDRTLHDAREHLDRTSQALVAHELAHQWFGDYLTCRTWRHLWLNEGFATYFEALYRRRTDGLDTFRLTLLDNQRAAMGGDREGRLRPMVETFFSRAPQGDGSNQVYVRGASVLGMIHHLLGEEAWWRAIRHYLTKHKGQLVTTEDFEIAIEEATGVNLHWLFEEFVYLPGHPQLTIQKSYLPDHHEVVLQLKQTQEGSPMVPRAYRYPVPIEIVCADSRRTHTVWIDQREQEIRLPAPDEPLMVRFDKGSAMLKEVIFPLTARELAYQAIHDDDVVGRLLAVEQLEEADDPEVARNTLLTVLGSQDHERVRARAAEALAVIGGPGVAQALVQGLCAPQSSVRRTCAERLATLKNLTAEERQAVTSALATTLKDDLSYATQAAAASSLAVLGGQAVLPALREACGYSSPDGQVAAAAWRGRLQLQEEGAAEQIVALARSFDPTSRRLGLELLGNLSLEQLGERRPEVIQLLLVAAEAGRLESRTAAIHSLGKLQAAEAEGLLQRLSEQRGNWQLRSAARRALSQIEEARRLAEPAPPAAGQDRLSGTWEGTATLPGGDTLALTLVLQRGADQTVRGRALLADGEARLAQEHFDPAAGRFTATLSTPIGNWILTGTLLGDTLSGEAASEEKDITATFLLTRKPAAPAGS